MEKHKLKHGNLVVVGSTNIDMVISASRFPLPGETIIGHDFMSNFGGKGANQAVAAARLGAKTIFIGKVGDDDFGNSTLSHLKEEGIDTSFIYRSTKASSGVALITTVVGGENTIIVNPGANFELSPTEIELSHKAFEAAAIVLMQLETPIDTILTASKIAKEYGCYVILNPAPAPTKPLPTELLENVDMLIPNKTEASTISGVDITDDVTTRQAIDKIKELGIKDVVITIGSHGVLSLIDGELTNIPAYKVKAVDTTAAGDTFCGALCAALLSGSKMPQALRFANQASAVTVTRRGAQVSMPHLEDIKLDISTK